MGYHDDKTDATICALRHRWDVLDRRDAFRRATLTLRATRYFNLVVGTAMAGSLFIGGLLLPHPVAAARLCGAGVVVGIVSFVIHLLLRGAINDEARRQGGSTRASMIDVELVITPSDVPPEN